MRSLAKSVGAVFRGVGQAVDDVGLKMQGKNGFKESVAIHPRLFGFGDKTPALGPDTFVAPNASLAGSVDVGCYSSVFYGAVLRGDGQNSVTIGDRTTISEHVTITADASPTIIGDAVIIGPGSSLHSCMIGDGVHIGAGVVIEHSVEIGPCSVIAAGSVIPSGTKIGADEVWGGSPATHIRAVDESEVRTFFASSGAYHFLANIHREHCDKSLELVEEEREWYEDQFARDEDYGASILDYQEPAPIPRLQNHVWPLQLRTYFETDGPVPVGADQVVELVEHDDPREVLRDTVAAHGYDVADANAEHKKSYWFISN